MATIKRNLDCLKIVLGLLGLSVPQIQAWWDILMGPLPFKIPLWVPLWGLIVWGILGLVLRGTKLWRDEYSATPTGLYHDTSRWHKAATLDVYGFKWHVMVPALPYRAVELRPSSCSKEKTLQVEGPYCRHCGQSVRQYSLIWPARIFTCNACGKRTVKMYNRSHMLRVATAKGQQEIEGLYVADDSA